MLMQRAVFMPGILRQTRIASTGNFQSGNQVQRKSNIYRRLQGAPPFRGVQLLRRILIVCNRSSLEGFGSSAPLKARFYIYLPPAGSPAGGFFMAPKHWVQLTV
jgi:hypothetical protein